MKMFLGLGLLIILAGCARAKSAREGKQPVETFARTNNAAAKASMTNAPAPFPMRRTVTVLRGQVASVNPALRFAVIDFGGGAFPEKNQMLSIYRAGVKVGLIKMTGPFQNTTGVGDISAGDAALGDSVMAE